MHPIFKTTCHLLLQLSLYCRLQPHAETRVKQIEAWKSLILEYFKTTKQTTLDVREIHSSPLFNNTSIDRIL